MLCSAKNCLREGSEIFDGLGKGVFNIANCYSSCKDSNLYLCEPNFPLKIKKLIGPQTDFFQGWPNFLQTLWTCANLQGWPSTSCVLYLIFFEGKWWWFCISRQVIMAQSPSWQTAISSDTRLQGIQFSNKNVEIFFD